MDDDPTPEELEQLARSLAMSGSLGEYNRKVVTEALRRLADIERAARRHPSNAERDDARLDLSAEAGVVCTSRHGPTPPGRRD